MALVADRVPACNLNEGDHVCFAYSNTHTNIPNRVGVIETLGSGYMLLWDYSLHEGPAHRTYKFEHIINMCLIQEVKEKTIGRLDFYKNMIVNLVMKFTGHKRTNS